jgi:Peptidase family M28
MIYERIYDFCKVRNTGSIYKNTDTPTPRVQFLMQLLEEEGIDYELDKFIVDDIIGYNIILRGDSDKMLVAHHDIVNPNVDNANDNSASVINAIALKKLLPQTHVVLLDGEEIGGVGAQRVSDQINAGDFGDIFFVLNLELTGRGGKRFFSGNYPGPLYDKIKSLFNNPTLDTPFNDSVIFRKNGIDSCVINPLPVIPDASLDEGLGWDDETRLDSSILYYCHTPKDTVDLINIKEMQEFTEEVVYKILTL